MKKYLGLFYLSFLVACGTDAPSTTVNNTVIKIDGGTDPVDMKGEADVGSDVEEDASTPSDMGEDPTECTKNSDCKAGQMCTFDPMSGKSFCTTTGGGMNGDACTDGSQCASGVCLNEACADLCAQEADCPAGFTCTSQSVQTANGSVDISACTKEVTPCLATADCPNGLVCVYNLNDGFECQMPTGNGDVGDACAMNTDCQSNLCVDNLCSAPCQRPSDCSTDGSFICVSKPITTVNGTVDANVCVPKPASQCLTDSDCAAPERCVATRSATDIEFQCGTPNAGGQPSGAACGSDIDCSQNLCVNNICAGPCQGNGDCSSADATCELVNVDVGNGNTDSVQICTPPIVCDEKAKCRVNETCYIRASQAATDLFCRLPNVGAGSLGQVCSIALECASNFCLDTRFRNVCTEVCNDNADCNVAGYSCQAFTFDDGTNAQICQPTTPPSCNSNDDCVAGTICSFVENTATSVVETLCVPSTGGDAAGVGCQSNDDCASLLCLDGFCSAPCADANQCPAAQLCQAENVTIGNSNGNISLCKTPPEIACSDASECTDGVRICSLGRDAMGNLAGFCAFPNVGGAQMGTTCAAPSDCRENVCLLNINDRCSVVCNDDADCAVGLGCTTYGDVGFCNKVCADNGDCNGGEICTINSDVIANDVDLVCQNANAGGGDLGDVCASGADCSNGLCLTTTSFTQTMCTTNAQCGMGETCECPVAQPNCMSGKLCASQEQLCTNLCNDNGDCSAGVMGNPLTNCSSNTVVQLPNGQGTKTLATCAQP